MKINQKGFGAVELVLILVAVSLIGAVGWFVYDRQNDQENKTETADSDSESSAAVPQESTEADFVVPEGWVKYENESEAISFYYPKSWDNWGDDYPEWTSSRTTGNEFGITRVAANDKLYPKAGQGSHHYFDFENNKWYHKEFDNDTTPELIDYLKTTTTPQTEYLVAYGMTGEGGGAWHVILITDGKSTYEITSPSYGEEFDKDPSGKRQELEDSALKIIQSIRFL